MTTKLLIVEDEVLFRDLLKRVLTGVSDIEVVGEAADAETALSIFKEKKPDVVLADIQLQGKMDGIEMALHIKQDSQQTGIVILSVHGERRYVSSLPLKNSGGWAYLLKKTVPDVETLLRAIEATKTGHIMLDPEVVRVMRIGPGSPIERLAPSKLDVLKLMAEGYSNEAIAKRLKLSIKSVENYINIIYQELNLSGETEVHARVKATLTYLASQ